MYLSLQALSQSWCFLSLQFEYRSVSGVAYAYKERLI